MWANWIFQLSSYFKNFVKKKAITKLPVFQTYIG